MFNSFPDDSMRMSLCTRWNYKTGDIPDYDPGMKPALADAVKTASSLKNMTDIIQQ